MSSYEMDDRDPPFRAMVRASGLAEVWTHVNDMEKFGQFGWRCTNKENSYANDTLVGNWNEDKFDISKQREAKRIPSQHDHYFETTYDVGYNFKPYEVPKELKHLKWQMIDDPRAREIWIGSKKFSARHPHAFPGHQPENDSAKLKTIYNSWETTTRSAYVDPKIRRQPIQSTIAETQNPAAVETK